MSSPPAWAPLPLAGAELLERAVGYTRTSLQLVAGTDLASATPCRGWTLLDLLEHMDDSLAAFTEAAAVGCVDLAPAADAAAPADPAASPDAYGPGGQLVARLRARACALLEAWTWHPATGEVAVADRGLRADVVAAAGALEIAVHGWDVARACGRDRPLPEALAADLLEVVPLLVADADRPRRFGPVLAVPAHAPPGSRLLAVLGRR
jgi:uncharacterized protein (TIGR03086 family)